MGTEWANITMRRRAGLFALLAVVLALSAPAGADSTVLSDVPDYDWFYGCSPTAAGMLIGYYDRNGYDDKGYGSLVPGGKAELNTFGAEYSDDWSAIVHSAIASEEHVDDYWGNPDPMDSDRTSTAEWNCLADFMGTSQGSKSNGVTMWHNATSTAHDWEDCSADYGLNGVVQYVQDVGYDVTSAYRQAVTTGSSGGFTFDDFKTEIDAGRPVLVHITGHTMLGYGYCDTTGGEVISVHDTWDDGGGTMTWGGSYSGKSHLACTAITLTGGCDQIDVHPGSPGWVGHDDGHTVTCGWQLCEAQWADNVSPSQESPSPGSPSMPGYTGSTAAETGAVVYNETESAWGVTGSSQYGELAFLIDNVEDLDEMKFVYLQFEVQTDGDGYFQVGLDSAGGELVTGGIPQLLGSEAGWDLYAVQWEIVPQPAFETITLELYTTAGGSAWLQNVLISTHCTPEPASAALLALALGAVIRRRKSRRPRP